ncbi:MAG: ABC transporter permease [Oscillospiraceae bacterium]|jgi:putative ABC transport system permease protein|nr:ABC transporter permease [Oscillospiraceae bacterium]
MMKHLFLKLLRDIKAAKGQYIAITLVVALGVAFYVGLASASSSVRANVDAFYEEQKLADLWAVFPSADDSVIEQIRALPDVLAADGRFTGVASFGESEFAVRSLPETPSVNIPAVKSGRLPIGAGECNIDGEYADANGLSAGDMLDVSINGADYALNIVGTVNSPEILFLAKNISEGANHNVYGALFVSGKQFNAYNEAVIKAAPNADLTALKSDIENLGAVVVLGRDRQLSYVMLDTDISQFDKLGVILPNIFFIVAAAIIFISMSKNVETQRGQIGNMKALGVRRGAITLHFLGYTVVTCALGCVLGALLGVFALLPGLQAVFNTMYTMPPQTPTGFVRSIAVASALAFAFGVCATVISVRKPLKESPASAMRPKPPKNVKPTPFENFPRLWNCFSFGTKIILRNLFMNKGRAILSSVGIVGCVGLMLAAFSFMDCINDVLSGKFYQTNLYDLNVSLKTPSADIEFGDDAAWRHGSISANFSSGGAEVATDLVALDADCDAIALYSENGVRLMFGENAYSSRLDYFPKDGVIIPKLYADRHNLSIGDALKLTLTPVIGEPRTMTVAIRGVAMEYLGQDIYTAFEYLDELGETLPVLTYLVQTDDAKGLADTLKENPAVRSAYTVDEIASSWDDMLSVLRTVVFVLIAASAVLALTVVYNISAINIFDRRRDVATLKVLGYRKREVNRLVFTENLIMTGFGSLFGIGAGAGFLRLIIGFVATDEVMMPIIMPPLSIAIAVVLGFAFTILANQLLRGKIRGIDMVESLKSVE